MVVDSGGHAEEQRANVNRLLLDCCLTEEGAVGGIDGGRSEDSEVQRFLDDGESGQLGNSTQRTS